MNLLAILQSELTQFGHALPGVLAQGLIWGVMAIGVYITYKILDFPDLTVDGSIGTGGAVALILILNGVPVWIALIASFVAGCLAGLVTGLLNTLLGIPGILAGILTQIALYSVNLAILGGANKSISVDKFPLLLSSRRVAYTEGFGSFGLEVGKCIIIVALLIAALYWFFGTEYGFTIRATGCNSNMARAQGINTKKSTVIALVLSNGLVGLSGGLLAQYQGFADVNMGRGAIVIGLAAVIIGEVLGTAIIGKHFNFVARLAFTAVGGIIYYLVLQIVMQIGLESTYNKLFSAIVVVLFLAVPYIKNASRNSYGRAARSQSTEKGDGDA
ncbi:MAG: ABC transporter permease [Ruminococcaceae bacterium]|nr:ABC transporter permease [Oscillospiraceae bacterium]